MRHWWLGCGLIFSVATQGLAQTDPSASYRTFHTSHFRIHFQPAHRDAAWAIAREAERAYALFARELSEPRGQIDIALADEFDISNGVAQVFPSSRITLFLTPPSSGTLIDYDDWLRTVTVHELAHVFHLDRAKGLWGALQRVFGRAPGLFPNQYQPSWVTEGIATYYESRFTNAGRVGSSPHRQIIQGELLRGLERRRDDATSVDTRWPGGNAAYAYGGEFFATLSAREGGAVPRYIESTAGQLVPFSTSRHVERITQDRIDPVWASILASTTPEREIPGQVELASALLTEPQARVSPDGRHVVYVHDDGDVPRHLRVVALATENVVRRHLVNGEVDVAWDGTDVIVSQLDWTGLYQLRSDLYRWNPLETGAWVRLTRDRRLTAPAAGGGLVTAIEVTPGGRAPVRVAGTSAEPLDVPVAGAVWQRVEPSPDGRWLAGIAHRRGAWDVVVWPRNNPDSAVWVTEDAAVESFVSWHGPDEIVYASDRSGVPQPYAWSRRGGNRRALHEAVNGTLRPHLAEDGRLVYAMPLLGGYGLRIADPRPPSAPLPAPEQRTFVPADSVAVRESGYAAWSSLRPHYWLPFGDITSSAGDFFGAFTSGQDIIRRTTYGLAGAIDPSTGRWIGFLSLTDRRFGRPVLDVHADQSWSSFRALVDSVPTQVFLRERDVEAGATFAWQRWRWSLSGRVGAGWQQDHFQSLFSRNFVTATAGVRLARSVSPRLAISRERGFDVQAVYRRREHLGSAGYSNEIRLRGGAFLPAPWSRHVLAVRVAYGETGGRFASGLDVGGSSGGGLDPVPGITLSTRRAFPVRGYPGDAVVGTRAFSATAEYRMPLLYVGRGVKPFPFGITQLSGAVFADIGGAWVGGETGRPWALAALGAELVSDVMWGFDFPVRMRFGFGVPVKTFGNVGAGELRLHVAIGSDF